MRSGRLLAALCAALLLAACSTDLLPPGGVAGSWSALEISGSGPAERSVVTNLRLGPDGRFVWSESRYGDGAGHPDQPGAVHSRLGHYRLRGQFLDLRVENMEFRPLFTDTPVRSRVPRPQWSGNRYRIEVDGDQMTLRFGDAPAEITMVFLRDIRID